MQNIHQVPAAVEPSGGAGRSKRGGGVARLSAAARLKRPIPRQRFKIPIQAALGNKAIAHEALAALGEGANAKCNGGGINLKCGLLNKQKEGK